jgi:hypothetical protein
MYGPDCAVLPLLTPCVGTLASLPCLVPASWEIALDGDNGRTPWLVVLLGTPASASMTSPLPCPARKRSYTSFLPFKPSSSGEGWCLTPSRIAFPWPPTHVSCTRLPGRPNLASPMPGYDPGRRFFPRGDGDHQTTSPLSPIFLLTYKDGTGYAGTMRGRCSMAQAGEASPAPGLAEWALDLVLHGRAGLQGLHSLRAFVNLGLAA